MSFVVKKKIRRQMVISFIGSEFVILIQTYLATSQSVRHFPFCFILFLCWNWEFIELGVNRTFFLKHYKPAFTIFISDRIVGSHFRPCLFQLLFWVVSHSIKKSVLYIRISNFLVQKSSSFYFRIDDLVTDKYKYS